MHQSMAQLNAKSFKVKLLYCWNVQKSMLKAQFLLAIGMLMTYKGANIFIGPVAGVAIAQ